MSKSEAIRTSVIIPVYNTVAYLRECVESVLAQTQKEIEIILVDDGSDDGSWEMAQEYAARYPFIKALRQEHLYQGTARNRGLKIARGEYVYFMDSDDAILPELFETAYAACEEKQLDFMMFDARGFRYDENDRELEVPDDIVDRRQMGIQDRIYTGPDYWNTFYNRHGLLYVCWLLYIRKSYLLENNLFYEERTYFEDNDWMLRMYLQAKRIWYMPEIFHRHRWRRGSNMLEGFTVGLLKGCFRMHRVLLALHTEYEKSGDPERLRMIEDVIHLNVRRFDRLSEIRPEPAYLEPLEKFCVYLREQLEEPDQGACAHYMHLAALMRILKAAGRWEGCSLCKTYGDLVNEGSVLRIPSFGPDTRVAVYGTGKVSSYYAEMLAGVQDPAAGNLFFVDTWKKDGSFCGYPLYNSHRLPALKPDVVIIASTKYQKEMKEAAADLCGGSTEIICVPREIRFLT